MSGERMRRPELPYVKLGAATKALGSNHWASVGLSNLPEAMRLGRCPPTPVFATSRDMVTVNGTPLRKIRMPCICHPPSKPFVKRFALPRIGLPFPNGSSYPKLNEKLCGTWYSEGPFSKANIPPTAGVLVTQRLLEKV